MAQIKNGHFGSYQGKIGAVTGVKRKGKFYIHQSITHNGSQTDKQLRQRNRFSVAMLFAQLFDRVVADTFAKRSGNGLTALNAFASHVAVDALSESTLDNKGKWQCKVVNNKVQIARGPIPQLERLSIGFDAAKNALKLGWDKENMPEGALPSDMVCVVAKLQESNEMVIFMNDSKATRGNGTLLVTVPTTWTDNVCDVWVYTKSQEKGRLSTSQFKDSVVCAA